MDKLGQILTNCIRQEQGSWESRENAKRELLNVFAEAVPSEPGQEIAKSLGDVAVRSIQVLDHLTSGLSYDSPALAQTLKKIRRALIHSDPILQVRYGADELQSAEDVRHVLTARNYPVDPGAGYQLGDFIQKMSEFGVPLAEAEPLLEDILQDPGERSAVLETFANAASSDGDKRWVLDQVQRPLPFKQVTRLAGALLQARIGSPLEQAPLMQAASVEECNSILDFQAQSIRADSAEPLKSIPNEALSTALLTSLFSGHPDSYPMLSCLSPEFLDQLVQLYLERIDEIKPKVGQTLTMLRFWMDNSESPAPPQRITSYLRAVNRYAADSNAHVIALTSRFMHPTRQGAQYYPLPKATQLPKQLRQALLAHLRTEVLPQLQDASATAQAAHLAASLGVDGTLEERTELFDALCAVTREKQPSCEALIAYCLQVPPESVENAARQALSRTKAPDLWSALDTATQERLIRAYADAKLTGEEPVDQFCGPWELFRLCLSLVQEDTDPNALPLFLQERLVAEGPDLFLQHLVAALGAEESPIPTGAKTMEGPGRQRCPHYTGPLPIAAALRPELGASLERFLRSELLTSAHEGLPMMASEAPRVQRIFAVLGTLYSQRLEEQQRAFLQELSDYTEHKQLNALGPAINCGDFDEELVLPLLQDIAERSEEHVWFLCYSHWDLLAGVSHASYHALMLSTLWRFPSLLASSETMGIKKKEVEKLIQSDSYIKLPGRAAALLKYCSDLVSKQPAADIMKLLRLAVEQDHSAINHLNDIDKSLPLEEVRPLRQQALKAALLEGGGTSIGYRARLFGEDDPALYNGLLLLGECHLFEQPDPFTSWTKPRIAFDQARWSYWDKRVDKLLETLIDCRCLPAEGEPLDRFKAELRGQLGESDRFDSSQQYRVQLLFQELILFALLAHGEDKPAEAVAEFLPSLLSLPDPALRRHLLAMIATRPSHQVLLPPAFAKQKRLGNLPELARLSIACQSNDPDQQRLMRSCVEALLARGKLKKEPPTFRRLISFFVSLQNIDDKQRGQLLAQFLRHLKDVRKAKSEQGVSSEDIKAMLVAFRGLLALNALDRVGQDYTLEDLQTLLLNSFASLVQLPESKEVGRELTESFSDFPYLDKFLSFIARLDSELSGDTRDKAVLAARRFTLGVLSGDWAKLRYTDCGIPKLEAWRAPVRLELGNLSVQDTDKPLDVIAAGEAMSNSCQAFSESPSKSRGVLGYALNPKNRVLFAYDKTGRPIGRCLLMCYQNEEGKNVLVKQMNYYVAGMSQREDVDRALEEGAKAKGRAMGAEVIAYVEPLGDSTQIPLPILNTPKGYAAEMNDAAHNMLPAEHSSHAFLPAYRWYRL